MTANTSAADELKTAVLDLITAKGLHQDYHQLFMDYLETGKLSDELTALCEQDEQCRDALEVIFDAQLKAIQEGRVHDSHSDKTPTARVDRPLRMAAMAAAIRDWLPDKSVGRLAEATAALTVVFVLGVLAGHWFIPTARMRTLPTGLWSAIDNSQRLIVEDDRVIVPAESSDQVFPGNYVFADGSSDFLVRLGKDDVDVKSVQVKGKERALEPEQSLQQRIQELLKNDQTLEFLLETRRDVTAEDE